MGLIIRSEEDSSRKDPLKCLDDSPIVAAVFRQVKEVEHLSGAIKVNGATLLVDGEGRHPDRDEAILAEGKAEIWMGYDLQKGLPVVPGVDELVLWRETEGDAAQNEGAGIVGELLVAVVTFFSDNGDRFEVTKAGFRNAQRW